MLYQTTLINRLLLETGAIVFYIPLHSLAQKMLQEFIRDEILISEELFDDYLGAKQYLNPV